MIVACEKVCIYNHHTNIFGPSDLKLSLEFLAFVAVAFVYLLDFPLKYG